MNMFRIQIKGNEFIWLDCADVPVLTLLPLRGRRQNTRLLKESKNVVRIMHIDQVIPSHKLTSDKIQNAGKDKIIHKAIVQ